MRLCTKHLLALFAAMFVPAAFSGTALCDDGLPGVVRISDGAVPTQALQVVYRAQSPGAVVGTCPCAGGGFCGWGDGTSCGCGDPNCRCGGGVFPPGFRRTDLRTGNGTYDIVYTVNPWHFDRRDGRLYSAHGYGVPMAVPLAPNVEHAYNFGWGVPSSRLTAISRPGFFMAP